MKNVRFLTAILVLSANFLITSAKAQNWNKNLFGNLETNVLQNLPSGNSQTVLPNSQIKDIQVFGEKSGIAYTSDTLFQTNDNGETWREGILPKSYSDTISTVLFLNESIGWVILANEQYARLEFVKTQDGGNSWTKIPINLRQEDLREAFLENASLESNGDGDFTLTFRLPTSSNFVGTIIYESSNDGQTWEFSKRLVEIRREDTASAEKISGNWTLKTVGNCEGSKVGCVQETKVFNRETEITPPQIKERSRIEKENARLEAQNSVFAAPPGGSTRISLNRGFDKCTAATVAQMQTWWNTSPFYDSNIYISGRNRGCQQPQLTAAWVDQVSAMGWGLIPTIVGYQAPCVTGTCQTNPNCQKHSSDAAIAETQGRGEADIAINDANNLGLTQGTVLYYDMERYDETSGTPGCRLSVNAFLKGWTDRVKEQGYISGVYGSPTNAVNDWISLPPASRMDAVWLARWDNVASVWYYAPPSPVVPVNFWSNHQRIKQWQAPHNETWGGVTFNIDGDISDAPVAGAAIAKNKTADFDGDGKTDISVFRPDAGSWYILNSSNSSFSGVAFGSGTDILAPGDYDGDGKTDTAVFRPGDGTWYFLTKAGVFNARQFGANGDIPVPADFNGDGKTDIAVFRPSNGVWYIANSDSRGTFNFVQFGADGDKPVQGDYDGDGKTDIAVWRPSTGSWYVLKSSDGTFYGIAFGASTDQPAQGDYDGDGKTDFVVFRPSNGVWYLLNTTNGFSAVQFGTIGDLPVTGDFDGDNKADVAVFRPSNGVWYLLQSRNGFNSAAFGVSTDKPIPNMYLPN
ncbi:MAG: glycoside hydrolase domain-containing protein [Pyrinomonadaceae bacterium]